MPEPLARKDAQGSGLERKNSSVFAEFVVLCAFPAWLCALAVLEEPGVTPALPPRGA